VLAENASIAGDVWKDNGNGVKDASEDGLGGVTVQLGVGNCDSTGFRQTTTDANGNYSFTSLPVGSYCVSVDITPTCGDHSSATTPTEYSLALAESQSATRSFGYEKLFANPTDCYNRTLENPS
jgi:hypothetical protein